MTKKTAILAILWRWWALSLKLQWLLAAINIKLLFRPLIQNRKCNNLTRQHICVLTHYPHQRKEKHDTIITTIFLNKTSMKIFLSNYLKSRKSHFWGALKSIIFTRSWAQNSRMGVLDCAKHDFTTENLISPLFGVVRDLKNRQKIGFFKTGSKRPI